MLIFTFSYVNAAAAPCDLNAGAGALSLPTWYKYLDGELVGGKCVVANQSGSAVILILFGVFDILLYIAVLLAIVMTVFGGYKLLTSTGEPQKVAAGRTTIVNSVVGLVIALIASQVVGFIAKKIAQ